MKTRLVSLLAVLCTVSAPLRAQESSTETKPAADTSALPKADAGNEAAIRALLGQKAVISGDVTNSFASEKAGMTFIAMGGGNFTVVCWKRSYDKFEGGSPADLYRGKKIEVTGMIEEYKGKSGTDAGKLQIKLNDPAQIRIIGESAVPADKETDKDKKGKDKEGGKKEKN